jgi:hypothetical protein
MMFFSIQAAAWFSHPVGWAAYVDRLTVLFSEPLDPSRLRSLLH